MEERPTSLWPTIAQPGDLTRVCVKHTMVNCIMLNEHDQFRKWVFDRTFKSTDHVTPGEVGMIIASIDNSRSNVFRAVMVLSPDTIGWSDTTVWERAR
jgi:hypothetical protein